MCLANVYVRMSLEIILPAECLSTDFTFIHFHLKNSILSMRRLKVSSLVLSKAGVYKFAAGQNKGTDKPQIYVEYQIYIVRFIQTHQGRIDILIYGF